MSSPKYSRDGVLSPSFSVVIPLYNKAPHVRRAIESVLSQYQPPSEVIVVDDGSTDGGASLVEQYRGHGVVLINRGRPGAGGYAARNLGIRSAQSDWIAFLDADDEWLPEHLSNLSEALASADRPIAVVGIFAGYMNVYNDGRRRVDPFTARVPERSDVTLEFADLLQVWVDLHSCPVWTSASAFRRRSLLDAGLFPEGRALRGGDKDTWLRVSCHGAIRFAPGVTAIYHRDAVNMVTRTSDTNIRHCMCETVEELAKQAPDKTKALLFRMLNEEMFQYGIYATERGKINRETYRGFNASMDPLRFAILLAASTSPGAAAIRIARRVRNLSSGY
jgi:GT2 family glycosyltransferase